MIKKNTAYEAMEKYDIDALIASTPENVFYISGLMSLGHKILRGTQVYAILPREKDIEPSIVCSIGEADLVAESRTWITDLRFYGAFYIYQAKALLTNTEKEVIGLMKIKAEKDPIKALLKALKEKGLANKKLGFDELGVSYMVFERIKSELSETEIVTANNIFRELRMIKTSNEIEKLGKAASINERALEASIEGVKTGTTEKDIAKAYESCVIKEGATPLFSAIGVGTRSALPNVVPSDYKVNKGDLIRLDVGCIYQNYSSDIARTFSLGEPSERKKMYYEAVLAGEQEAIKNIKPGIQACDIFQIAVETVRKEGIPHCERSHCGHGIGVECYDDPLISPTNTTILQEGMVLCIEPPYYELGFGGFQVEDEVVVTKEGTYYLSTIDRKLRVI